MPLPTDLAGTNANRYAQVWSGRVNVTGGTRTKSRGRSRVFAKNFITYIEVFEQTAHDSGLHGFARQRGIDPRRAHRGQVSPTNAGNNALTYYATHGQVAAGMVAGFITQKWNETVTTNDNTFVQRSKRTLTSQSDIQDNGFSYDVTMYYDGADIYVAFHCYHAG